MKKYSFLIVTVIVVIYACSPKPFGTTNKAYRKQSKEYAKLILAEPVNSINDTIKLPPYWVGTTNYGIRKPNFVIIHHTAQNSCLQTLETFTLPRTAVSAHYVICKDGTVHHMLNDYFRAQHAGVSRWGNLIDINSSSIGIELDNTGFEPFDSLQLNSLISVLAKLKKDYNIPTQNILGHADIAPGRKQDPSALFPWKTLAEKGFGIWPDEVLEEAPFDFKIEPALRIIGYNTKNLSAAIMAFKLHYIQTDTTVTLDRKTIDTIYSIYKKQLQ